MTKAQLLDRPVDTHEVFAALCQAHGVWGLLVHPSAPCDDYPEALKACPVLTLERDGQIVADGLGFLFYKTEAEMRTDYGRIVGDDGPTAANPYDGPARCYALTCGPDGLLLSVNT